MYFPNLIKNKKQGKKQHLSFFMQFIIWYNSKIWNVTRLLGYIYVPLKKTC